MANWGTQVISWWCFVHGVIAMRTFSGQAGNDPEPELSTFCGEKRTTTSTTSVEIFGYSSIYGTAAIDSVAARFILPDAPSRPIICARNPTLRPCTSRARQQSFQVKHLRGSESTNPTTAMDSRAGGSFSPSQVVPPHIFGSDSGSSMELYMQSLSSHAE